MKKDQMEPAPQNMNYNEIFFQEKEIGEDIPNQWSLKLKKIESIILPGIKKAGHNQEWQPVDIKRSLLLKKDGKASITFDVSTLKKYSICIINESDYSISFCLEMSPDNLHYLKKSPYMEVAPWQVETVSSNDYLKYARIKLFGKNTASVIVYLQGIK